MKISQDRLIPIYYREEIALNSIYPITAEEIADAYSELSDYILDSERIAINRQYLAGDQKYSMLRQLSFDDKKLITLSGVERFLRLDMQTLLIYRFDEELYGMKNKVEQGHILVGDLFLPLTTYIFYNPKGGERYKDILTNTELSPERQGLELIRAAVGTCSEEEMPKFGRENKWNSIEELQDVLKVIIPKDEIVVLRDTAESSLVEEAEVYSRIKVVINLTEDFLTRDFARIRESVLGLIAAYKNIEFIEFKFVMKFDLWRRYQEDFVGLKATTIELNVLPEDIQFLVYRNVNSDLFAAYLKMMRINDGSREMRRRYRYISGRAISNVQLLEVMELLIGIRKDVKTYSSSVCDYVYSFLNSNKQICYNRLVDAIQLAVQMELEGEDQTGADDRLISFENLKYALESLKE